jgi:hypothetical protein
MEDSPMRRQLFTLLFVGCLFAIPASTFAADFQYVSDPSLMTLSPGNDGFWDTADDFTLPGWNPLGAASAFVDAAENVGFWTGTFATNNSGPNTFGVNTLSSVLNTGEFTNSGLAVSNSPFSQTLSAGTTNTVTISPDHTLSVSFALDQSDDFGGHTLSFTGDFFWILPGENPADVFTDPGRIAHFNFLIPLLPPEWTILVSGFESYIFTSGFLNGLSGASTTTGFSTDPGAVAVVPVPAVLPLFSLALAGLWRMRRSATRQDKPISLYPDQCPSRNRNRPHGLK